MRITNPDIQGDHNQIEITFRIGLLDEINVENTKNILKIKSSKLNNKDFMENWQFKLNQMDVTNDSMQELIKKMYTDLEFKEQKKENKLP